MLKVNSLHKNSFNEPDRDFSSHVCQSIAIKIMPSPVLHGLGSTLQKKQAHKVHFSRKEVITVANGVCQRPRVQQTRVSAVIKTSATPCRLCFCSASFFLPLSHSVCCCSFARWINQQQILFASAFCDVGGAACTFFRRS